MTDTRPSGPLPDWADTAHQHLAQADPIMAALVGRQGLVMREICRDQSEYFGRLARAIVGQQISTKAAASIFGRLIAHTGEPIAPAALIALDEETLRACGLSTAKRLALRDLAQHALDGRLDLEHLATLPDEAVLAQLIAVRGIGRWTAEMFLMFALGRPDVLAADDLGIQNAIQRVYALDTRPTPQAVRHLAIEGRWHPYATAACFHLWHSLHNTPA